MRLRNVKNAASIISSSKYIINDPEMMKGKWHQVFGNNQPIHIEIGMGKGQFILENALKYPHINFIGIEKFDSVMVRAVQKIGPYDLPNLILIKVDASDINNIFDHEIALIYLNFSDPWPKDRHYKRRLTSDVFLDKYDTLFRDNKTIHFKTDNEALFNYSKESLANHKYNLNINKFNLNNMPNDNIETEYEEKFLKLGHYIYKIEANSQ